MAKTSRTQLSHNSRARKTMKFAASLTQFSTVGILQLSFIREAKQMRRIGGPFAASLAVAKRCAVSAYKHGNDRGQASGAAGKNRFGVLSLERGRSTDTTIMRSWSKNTPLVAAAFLAVGAWAQPSLAQNATARVGRAQSVAPKIVDVSRQPVLTPQQTKNFRVVPRPQNGLSDARWNALKKRAESFPVVTKDYAPADGEFPQPAMPNRR
jgi:hypothetical protein